ncbi:Zinc finger protein JAGGED [Carex littledalei]|uniref:Zinc finger protein JAGGED n=1 Tax=Carex littledalei TaxID=544730 RepID=A0A833RIH6_9POAL|nr:Zinc finger protein JAGGED [Carex littledalei]
MEGSGENVARYPCKFCDKVFFSYQAYGGHQNSHREERETAVVRQREANLPIQTVSQSQRLLLDPTVRAHVPNVGNMHTAPRMQPLFLPTICTRAPNNGNVQMPHHSNYYFRRPTYLPTCSIPRESIFHPYARRNHIYQNSNLYNGFGYPSTNPLLTTFRYPTHRLPLTQQQVITYAEPRMYDFFVAENNNMTATSSQANIHVSNPSIGVEERSEQNLVAGPSNASTEKYIGDDKCGANNELDLTLRL